MGGHLRWLRPREMSYPGCSASPRRAGTRLTPVGLRFPGRGEGAVAHGRQPGVVHHALGEYDHGQVV
jgi:hypothetical protein